MVMPEPEDGEAMRLPEPPPDHQEEPVLLENRLLRLKTGVLLPTVVPRVVAGVLLTLPEEPEEVVLEILLAMVLA